MDYLHPFTMPPVDRHRRWAIVCQAVAIRFQCGACAQPIEVDDEWASKTVACPYCHKTVTAPAASTLEDLSEIPTASPLAAGDAATPYPPSPYQEAPVAHPTNRLALVALILACCSIALLIMTNVILGSHRLELAELEETMTHAKSFTEKMEAQSKFFETNPEAPRWLISASMLVITSGLMDLAAIVCALIAVRRPRRRGLAVAALAIGGLVPIFFCCGGLFPGPTG